MVTNWADDLVTGHGLNVFHSSIYLYTCLINLLLLLFLFRVTYKITFSAVYKTNEGQVQLNII